MATSKLQLIYDVVLELRDRIGSVENRICSLEDRISSVEDRLIGLDNRMSSLERQFRDLSDQLNQIRRTQTEDSIAFAGTYVEHDKRICLLEKILNRAQPA